MPKRTDISKIMIVGSGPIIIGQACEFDYSGTQACDALKEEGYEIILVNSNPATIMTDLRTADKTYIEPVNTDFLLKIIEKELPDAILPTLGGQIGLNSVLALHKSGIIKQFNIEVLGVDLKTIEIAESRASFKRAMLEIGFRIANSKVVSSLSEAVFISGKIGFPLIVRSSFVMGGAGSGVAIDSEGLRELVIAGLNISPISQVILEEFLSGWKEFELELVCDNLGNSVVICSIENVDPIGIHTGDSITVAPVQTLTDKEYQNMRNAAINILHKVGIKGGGANVQFAINSKTGEMVIIEMNPRVSRSSALASKATGFPIAKVVSKLAIGYTLNEIKNDITEETVAYFEPSIDYCVVKIPAWDLDKFSKTNDILTSMMKSVGETMAIGRTFKEAIQKAIRSLVIGAHGFGITLLEITSSYEVPSNIEEIKFRLKNASTKRLLDIYCSFHLGLGITTISDISGIDSWFISQLYQIFEAELEFVRFFLKGGILKYRKNFKKNFLCMKKKGFSDLQIGNLINFSENKIKNFRLKFKIKPIYKSVDSCAAEFSASSPYYYSSYEDKCEVENIGKSKKIIILGSGPNRIGQGIEFDYCCVHASLALKEEGIKSIIINSNPETVSTDCDISHRLYFEPLTYEDIVNIFYKERAQGIIIQFGGQIPLNLAENLEKSEIVVFGTQSININYAENRKLFQMMLKKIGLNYPKNGVVSSVEQAIEIAASIGYPLMVRPSFVLGGNSIDIAYNLTSLINIVKKALSISYGYPVIIDEFLENAIELDVDVISDGRHSYVCGIMEHVENAGIHSGDSACVFPPQNVENYILSTIETFSKIIAFKLNIIGFMNVQYAIKDRKIYVIEVNPRASRTIPFISKATGVPFVNYVTKILLGNKLLRLGLNKNKRRNHITVKESVFPFDRFINENISLGPSMKSTGEVMGMGSSLDLAYAKAQISAGQNLPLFGVIFVDYNGKIDKNILQLITKIINLNFKVIIDKESKLVKMKKLKSAFIGDCFLIIDWIKLGKIKMVMSINDISFRHRYSYLFRRKALEAGIPYFTTLSAALTVCNSIEMLLRSKDIKVKSLQDYHLEEHILKDC